jgi:hypothetical protein
MAKWLVNNGLEGNGHGLFDSLYRNLAEVTEQYQDNRYPSQDSCVARIEYNRYTDPLNVVLKHVRIYTLHADTNMCAVD